MSLLGKIILNIFPMAFYIKLCRKCSQHYSARLLKEDITRGDDGNWNYLEVSRGKVITMTHYMLPEVIYIDESFSKENRLKELKKEISKLENNNE